MLSNLTIKMKLSVSAFVAVAGMVSLLVLLYYAVDSSKQLESINTKIENLNSNMLMLRRNEKDFILRKNLSYLNKFNKNMINLRNSHTKLKNSLKQNNIDNTNIIEFENVVKKYETIFKTYVKKQEYIGLNEKIGLYGSLRNSVHKIQESAKQTQSFELLSIVYDLRKQEKDFMLRRNTKYVNKFKKKIDSLQTKQTLINSQIKNYLALYKKDFLALVKAEEEIGLNSKTGIQGNMRTTIQKTEEILKALTIELDKEIIKKEKSMLTIIFSIASLFIFLVAIISYFIAKATIVSLDDFKTGLLSFFKYLNKEASSVESLVTKGKDEIALMAKTVNEQIKTIEQELEQERKLIDVSIKTLKEYEQGDFNSKININCSNQALNELSNIINNMSINLEKNIDNILTVLESYSNSNYRPKIEISDKKAHLLKLSNGVNDLGNNISLLLKKSLEVGLTLDDSSNILIDNVKILNDSSNTAAASLEETAAALEEVTGSIVNSSESLTEMDNFAKVLSQSALKGQKQAANTTNAMEEITEQVNLINDSITVIDQIAFQTNILSLNAAVEAATAGEAGKGFAVVAQEVRNLASRSAEAAKEIKDIVEAATTKAAEGKQTSGEMSKGYNSLLENIENTTKKIEEINHASKEQQTGITQINDAVNKLDKQTQENASIASKTNDIATQTDEIAKEIVSDAQSKEFLGKEDAKLNKIETTITSPSLPKTSKNTLNENKVKTNKTSNKHVVQAKNNSDDEWESF